MQKVWKLYALATNIINKLCENKCIHLGLPTIEACYDYIRKRLEKDEFQALKNYDPTKGAKETTFLHMLIGCRLIDFMNSCQHTREFASDASISNRSDEREEELEADVSEIIERLTEDLSYEEQTYLKLYYMDEYSHKKIDKMLYNSSPKASKKLENIRRKLQKKAQKLGLTLEDIL